MITTKQRSKSYRVAQHDTDMRDACKINVRGQTYDRSFTSENYPNVSKIQRKSQKKEVCPIIGERDGALLVVPKMRGISWMSPGRADRMTEDQMTGDQLLAEQQERSAGR